MFTLPENNNQETFVDCQLAVTFAKRRAESPEEGKTLYEICKEMYLAGHNYQVYPCFELYETGNDADDEINTVCNRIAIEFGLDDEAFNPDFHDASTNWNVEITLFRL